MAVWIIPVALGVIALVITLVVIARRTGAAVDAPLAAYVGGIISAIVIAAITVISVVNTLVAPAINVSLPVGSAWPQLPPTITAEGRNAVVTEGGFISAQVTIEGLDFAARAWLAGGILILGATLVIVSSAVAVLYRQLLNDDPFRPVVARALTVSGMCVAIGGVGWQIVSLVGGFVASRQVLDITGLTSADGSISSLTQLDWSSMSTSFALEGWPLPIGAALIGLALVIRRGEVLQRETDGLV